MMFLDFLAAEAELYQRLSAPVEETYGLTSMELAIVLFLANNPEHDTATEIVKIRHLTKSHVSTSIRSLEEKGLLRKAYRSNDHRTVHLSLTKKADVLVKDGRAAQAVFYEILQKGFTEEENAAIASYFLRMKKNVNEALKGKESENE